MSEYEERTDNPGEVPEGIEQPGDAPEDLEAALAWLEELAAKQGAPLEELPSLYDRESPGTADDLYPDWLTTDLSGLLAAQEMPPGGHDVVEEDDSLEMIAGTIPEWLRESVELQVPAQTAEPIPSKLDDDLSWLDQIAAGEGAAIEEPPTLSWEQSQTGGVPDNPKSSDPALSWLDELAGGEGGVGERDRPGTDLSAAEDEGKPARTESDTDRVEAEHNVHTSATDEPPRPEQSPTDVEALDVPEDLDEAMAWLEQLAARQGAPIEELPSIKNREPDLPEIPTEAVEDANEVDLTEALAHLPESEEGSGTFPEDPDQAFAWLAQLAAEDISSRTVDTSDRAEVTVTEEPPTPALPQELLEATAIVEAAHVRELRAGQLESDYDEFEDLLEAIPDDPDEAMAWLERLAQADTRPVEERSAVELDVETEMDLSDAEPPEQLVSETSAVGGDAVQPERLEENEIAPSEPLVLTQAELTESLPDWLDVDLASEEPDLELAWLTEEADPEAWLEAEEESLSVEMQVPGGPEATVSETEPELSEREAALPVFSTANEAAEELSPLGEAEGPERESSLLISAREAWSAGNRPTAIAAFEAALEEGSHVDALISELRAAVEETPDPKLQQLLGDAYVQTGALQQALDLYRAALDNL